jgi:hypothetical protein
MTCSRWRRQRSRRMRPRRSHRAPAAAAPGRGDTSARTLPPTAGAARVGAACQQPAEAGWPPAGGRHHGGLQQRAACASARDSDAARVRLRPRPPRCLSRCRLAAVRLLLPRRRRHCRQQMPRGERAAQPPPVNPLATAPACWAVGRWGAPGP